MTDMRWPGRDEAREEVLDPHRREAREHVAGEMAARLRARGVALTGSESCDEVVSLLDAVERFERAVAFRGGDLMVDSGAAAEPDDPLFVLPKRAPGEPVALYLGRIGDAMATVRRRGGDGA
ncbi:MAG TPA: hypothetical protein VFS05_07100 [Gemmatimonadaceae bacterium]|nr:hypothetical protein [Gemmatimonadaceae bacterium]